MEAKQQPQDQGELIASIEKNEETTVDVRKLEYKGEEYWDVREFVHSETYQGPTKKGIRLHRSLLPELVVALSKGVPEDDEVEDDEE